MSLRGPEEGITDSRRNLEMCVRKKALRAEDPACIRGLRGTFCAQISLNSICIISRAPHPPLPRCPRDLTPLFTPPGQNEGTISVVEGETLSVIEEDKGDGWTRIRRNEDEEGYVPTSYVEVYLDKNAKGAKTYI